MDQHLARKGSPLLMGVLFLAVPSLVSGCSRTTESEKKMLKAVGGFDLDKIKEIVEADPSVVNVEGEFGKRPLHFAARASRDKALEYLLSKGAEVDARDWDKKTPLHHGARSGKKEVVEILLKHGADPNAEARQGLKPADIAEEYGHTEVAEMLRAAEKSAE